MNHFRLYLLGALRVVAPDGTDVTPKGAKAQALIALLAMPPGRTWSRAAIQDKLWSDRALKQGRDSLKKEIATARKVFANDDVPALTVSGMLLRLEEAHVRVDIYDADLRAEHAGPLLPELLEGIDVRDPEFEEWLREARSRMHDRVEPASAATWLDRACVSQETRLRIGILPVVASTAGLDCSLLADMIADRLAITLRQLDLFDVADFREAPQSNLGRGTDITLQVKAMMLDRDLAFTVMAHETGSRRLLWADRRMIALSGFGAEEVACLVAQLLDRLVSALCEFSRRSDTDLRSATRFALDAIDLMFRMQSPSIDGANRALRNAIDVAPSSPVLALYAFNNVFRLEATKGCNLVELREHTDELVARALEVDRFNPFARSLITHVYSFMFRDFEAADRMIAPLAAAPPDTPFYYHALAALRLYTGRLDEARAAAEISKTMSRFSPYHYAFSTTIAAVNTVDNRLDEAIAQGEQVVAMHRGLDRIYEPALRYLSAAYGLKNDISNARRITGLIEAQSPGFSLQSLEDDRYPVPSQLSRDVMRTGLIRAGGLKG